MKIEFENREIIKPGFTAYAADGVLRLPQKFEPLCTAQQITDAEGFLEFARAKDEHGVENNRVTLMILIGNMDASRYYDECNTLERIIHSQPMKSPDLTPTAPLVDPTADTPTMPGVVLDTNTAAAE